MQFKSISLLVLLLGLVALVHGAAVAAPDASYKQPHGYNQNTCRQQCHNSLKPIYDGCNSAYSSHGNGYGGHSVRDNGGFDLSQSFDIISVIEKIDLTIFIKGCHVCFFLSTLTCVFGYTETKWDATFFAACIDTQVDVCFNTY